MGAACEAGVAGEEGLYEVLWVTPVGTAYGGSDAVAKLLMSTGGAWSPLGAALLVPARSAAHVLYRLAADNRSRQPGRSRACAVPEPRSA
ncbi:thiol-disulfide oxidoreductase DCC family protein [Streptomyces sp. NPDC127113]|uniref:thiol-disulfide oxidoreductase DCC family protein n=1 Tax=Streptomyces sp. NPDC127113 TaxID=3345365 RepID=UPI00362655E0